MRKRSKLFIGSQASASAKVDRLSILPAELVYEIIGHLDDLSRLRVSLTCRSLYRFWKRGSISYPDKRKLLNSLDVANPSLYYCFRCNKMVPWDASGIRREGIELVIGRPHACDRCQDIWMLGGLCFQFRPARLVMNRHFFGEEHGIEPQALEFAHNYKGKGGSKVARVWRARVIGDELYMASLMTIWHKDGDARELRRFITKNKIYICAHRWVKVSKDGDRRRPDEPHLRIRRGLRARFVAQWEEVKGCRQCLTDCSMHTFRRRVGKDRKWVIKIATYHNMGSLRCPDDWKWKSVTGFLGKYYEPERHVSGSVMNRWTASGPDVWMLGIGQEDCEWAKCN